MLMVSALLSVLLLGSATDNQGPVVVAKAAPHVLLIWNAAPLIGGIVKNKTPDRRAFSLLESTAAKIMAQENLGLKGAADITLRVVYPRDPTFNPAYGTSVISTVERLMTLSAKPRDIAIEGARWPAQLGNGHIPKKLTVQITGQLPPR